MLMSKKANDQITYSSQTLLTATSPSISIRSADTARDVFSNILVSLMRRPVEHSRDSPLCEANFLPYVDAYNKVRRQHVIVRIRHLHHRCFLHTQLAQGKLFVLRSGCAFVDKPALFIPVTAWDSVTFPRATDTKSPSFDVQLITHSDAGLAQNYEFHSILRKKKPEQDETFKDCVARLFETGAAGAAAPNTVQAALLPAAASGAPKSAVVAAVPAGGLDHSDESDDEPLPQRPRYE